MDLGTKFTPGKNRLGVLRVATRVIKSCSCNTLLNGVANTTLAFYDGSRDVRRFPHLIQANSWIAAYLKTGHRHFFQFSF